MSLLKEVGILKTNAFLASIQALDEIYTDERTVLNPHSAFLNSNSVGYGERLYVGLLAKVLGYAGRAANVKPLFVSFWVGNHLGNTVGLVVIDYALAMQGLAHLVIRRYNLHKVTGLRLTGRRAGLAIERYLTVADF